jgi:hypothetical protein
LLGSSAEIPLPQSIRISLLPVLISCGRHRHHALWHVGGFGGGQRLLLGDVRYEFVGHRERARPVVDRGAFVGADLVAIEAGRLRG